MPVHDWTRVDTGTFHDFHLAWIAELRKSLNRGVLPAGYYAQAEQVAASAVPDVLALQRPQGSNGDPLGGQSATGGGVAITTAPATSFTSLVETAEYTARQRQVVIRHSRGHRIVAFLEIVSPGNKASDSAFQTVLTKLAGALYHGIHLLVLDLLPPTPRDPNGIHAALWNAIRAGEFVHPVDRPLTLVSYEAGPVRVAHIEPIVVGQVLPPMPLFLEPGRHVSVPLESTYGEAWEGMPNLFRTRLESPTADE